MFKKRLAVLALCALLAGCGASSGESGTRELDWDSLPKHPPFDYFTVCWYDGRTESRICSEDNEESYFMEDELYHIVHKGITGAPYGSWAHSDDDWTLFENIERLNADRPVFKAALEMPDPTEDLQRETIACEIPFVKFVWSANGLVSADGSVSILDRPVEMLPGDTVRTFRRIAVFLESPEEDGRLDYVIFTQDPESGEYLYWDAHVEPEAGSWFWQELDMYCWYHVL